MAEDGEDYPLHRAVFEDDKKTLSRLLRKHDITAKDKHGTSESYTIRYVCVCNASFLCLQIVFVVLTCCINKRNNEFEINLLSSMRMICLIYINHFNKSGGDK